MRRVVGTMCEIKRVTPAVRIIREIIITTAGHPLSGDVCPRNLQDQRTSTHISVVDLVMFERRRRPKRALASFHQPPTIGYRVTNQGYPSAWLASCLATRLGLPGTLLSISSLCSLYSLLGTI